MGKYALRRKAQSASSRRAMFAKLGGGNSGGAGGGGKALPDKLWAKNPETGKREAPASQRQRDADAARDRARELFRQESELQSRIRRLGNEQAKVIPLQGYYNARENKRRRAETDRLELEMSRLQDEMRGMQDQRAAEWRTYEQLSATKSARYAQRRADRAFRRSTVKPGASAGTLAVFKDASGQWRWLAVTTTAFQDRDREIISRAALKADVARTDRDGLYGPLRYWHVGTPNQSNPTAPWGQGADIGTCDFSALSESGLSLIESGTFKSEAVAQRIAAVADQLEMSPGFFYPRGSLRDGVYHTIRRFERSIVPRWAGRASNLFTAFAATKGSTVAMDATKRKALEQMGLSPADLQAFLTETQQREKAAQAQGVALKSQQPTITIEGRTFGLVPIEEPTPEPVEEPIEEPAESKSSDVLVIGDMTPTEFKAFLEPLLAPLATKAATAPLSPADAEIAALKSQLDAMAAQLAELTGEQPPAIKSGGYRASQALDTVRQKAAERGIDTADPIAALNAQLGSLKMFGGE